MRSMGAAVAAAVVVGLAGCSGGASSRAVTPQACVDALDQADAAFTQMGQNITTVQQAFDQAASGNPSEGTATLQQVQHIDPTPYKSAEAQCRADAK